MGKLLNGLGLFALAPLLAAGGFGGYLFGSGHLNRTRVDLIAGVLRGEFDPPTDPNAGIDPNALTTRPAEQRGTSAEEAQARRRREDLESLRLERAQSDLEAQRRLLDQVLQQVLQGQEKLAADKAEYEKQVKAARRKVKQGVSEDDGFRKEVELVKGLKPTQAKDHIIRLWGKQKAEAVRLFMALDNRQSAKILEQFQTPEESQLLSDLLEQIRIQGQEGTAISSGKTSGAAAP